MKLSFSTLGCPGWSWDEIFATAKDLCFDGIEIRGIGNELYVPNADPFKTENIKDTIARLIASGLCIPLLTTDSCMGTGDRNENINEAMCYIDLAEKLQIPYIRVMLDKSPEPAESDTDEALSRMQILCDYAAQHGTVVLMETNSLFANSDTLVQFMEKLNSPAAGVLWDIHHPYRFYGESPEKTVSTLGNYIRHVHLKDSVKIDEKIVYRMMGYGDVPIFDSVRLLDGIGYTGFLSLEWVKRWNPTLEEPGIVFAHYMSYMKQLIGQLIK